MSPEDKTRSYLLLARDEQQQYATNLLRENEKLRTHVATLESDCRRLEDLQRSTVGELDRLRVCYEDAEREDQSYAEQHHQIETHNANLANLYVASYQLHSTVERETVLNTIQEIVINLIGSEQVAVFQADGPHDFRLASSFGVDAARLRGFRLGDGPVGRCVAEGQVWVNGEAAGGVDQLTACVPLKIDGTVFGAVLVFRLLDHKPALQPVDHELLELLSIHAAKALYCASLHARISEAVPG